MKYKQQSPRVSQSWAAVDTMTVVRGMSGRITIHVERYKSHSDEGNKKKTKTLEFIWMCPRFILTMSIRLFEALSGPGEEI